jgi:hypothetical protein
MIGEANRVPIERAKLDVSRKVLRDTFFRSNFLLRLGLSFMLQASDRA